MRGWLLQLTPSSYVSLSSCRMTLLSHHDFLLENLLIIRKLLIHSYIKKQKRQKEQIGNKNFKNPKMKTST